MIHAASRAALDTVQAQVTAVIHGVRGVQGGGDDLTALADQLYSVSSLLAVQPRLRRALGDPATAAGARIDLARRLLGGKISDGALALVTDAVGRRWSNPWDLSDALSIAGDWLLLGAASNAGRLDDVEDELFRFGRITRGSDELRSLLDEQSVPADRRVRLLHSVLDGKADPITVSLLAQGVRNGRKRTVALAVDDLLELTSQLRGQSVADVTSAVALSEEQESRLTGVLSRMYGRQITVRAQVDPAVQGGLVVRVGDEVIDGSVARRLATVKAELAG